MEGKYTRIQDEIIRTYRINLCDGTKCKNDWSRTHAHPNKRMVCKWKRANSVESTFTLLHEVGHIECHASKFRRCEDEFIATEWAIERCHEYGLEIPKRTMDAYQRYIDEEKKRGERRGATFCGDFTLKV